MNAKSYFYIRIIMWKTEQNKYLYVFIYETRTCLRLLYYFEELDKNYCYRYLLIMKQINFYMLLKTSRLR